MTAGDRARAVVRAWAPEWDWELHIFPRRAADSPNPKDALIDAIAAALDDALAAERAAHEAARGRVHAVLAESWHGGSRVTNCVVHSGLAWDRRPEGCKLCATDISNQLSYAIRLNAWLNERLAIARAALTPEAPTP